MATIFVLVLFLGVMAIFGLSLLDSRGVRNSVPSKLTMARTDYNETRDTGFGG